MWSQASLPVHFGGLGIRSTVQFAPSAFLASAAASSDLVHQILPPHLQSAPLLYVPKATELWAQGHDHPPPDDEASRSQKNWDIPRVSAVAEDLLQNAVDARSRARLLATSTREAGLWLNVFPITSLGLRMDDQTIRVAVGLHLGAPLCRPHTCHHCGTDVDDRLSCRRSEGRHHRHAALNDILVHALSSAQVPSQLEPTGLDRGDGKRPDGATIIPWKSGKYLVWDVTCPDTFAPSYVSSATSQAGAVASLAEEKKVSKYSYLNSTHLFTPVAVGNIRCFWANGSGYFMKELGSHLNTVSGDNRSRLHLFQRLSVAIQRGNAASMMGSMGPLPLMQVP